MRKEVKVKTNKVTIKEIEEREKSDKKEKEE
jgi:hypothetical protein